MYFKIPEHIEIIYFYRLKIISKFSFSLILHIFFIFINLVIDFYIKRDKKVLKEEMKRIFL